MLNQVVLVGRIVEDVKVDNFEERKVVNVTLAVQRAYKNVEGVYETDFIPVTLWGGIAENTAEYCKKGDLVGVKGRLEKQENELRLVADKVTFLSSKAQD